MKAKEKCGPDCQHTEEEHEAFDRGFSDAANGRSTANRYQLASDAWWAYYYGVEAGKEERKHEESKN